METANSVWQIRSILERTRSSLLAVVQPGEPRALLLSEKMEKLMDTGGDVRMIIPCSRANFEEEMELVHAHFPRPEKAGFPADGINYKYARTSCVIGDREHSFEWSAADDGDGIQGDLRLFSYKARTNALMFDGAWDGLTGENHFPVGKGSWWQKLTGSREVS